MQRLIHYLGQSLVPAEVLVVELGVASWVDPTEIRHSIELSDSLVDQVAEAQPCAVLECIQQLAVLVLFWMVIDEELEDVLDLRVYAEVRDVQVSATLLLVGNAASEGRVIQVLLCLTSSRTYRRVEPWHFGPVFQLVQ